MDQNARTLLLTDLEKNLNNPDNQSYRPETITAIQAVAKACQAKHAWSAKAMQSAILYTMPVIGWPLAERIARGKRLDPDALVARFRALPVAERNNAVNDAVFGKLARESEAAGELDGSNAKVAGALYGLLGIREKSLADFKAN